MPASIAYHSRTSAEAISCCRRPTLTARRHEVDDQISGRHATDVVRPTDRSTWEIPLIVVVMTPTNHPRWNGHRRRR